MSELNRLKVVDFTCGRLDSDDINTDIPFADSFSKTRTIQQANAVIGAYVNRNYKDNRQWLTELENKADRDEIPTKTSELDNDSGYITIEDIPPIPTKTSDLDNDSGYITIEDIPPIPTKTSDLDNDSGFITNTVNDLTNYTNNTDLTTLLNGKASKTDLDNLKNYVSGEVVIGTWIDTKPLYRKVLTGSLVGGDLDVDVSSLNIDTLININGMTSGRPLNFYYSGYSVSTRYSPGHIYINSSSAYAGESFYMVVEYTKTTN